MMKHLKRLSALLIALAIFFTGIPASAFYEDEETVTLTEVQETDYSSAENVDMSFELLILPHHESGTTYSFTYDGFARNLATKDKPYKIYFDEKNNLWFITVTLPSSYFGGTANAIIQKEDGKVLAVWHEK